MLIKDYLRTLILGAPYQFVIFILLLLIFNIIVISFIWKSYDHINLGLGYGILLILCALILHKIKVIERLNIEKSTRGRNKDNISQLLSDNTKQNNNTNFNFDSSKQINDDNKQNHKIYTEQFKNYNKKDRNISQYKNNIINDSPTLYQTSDFILKFKNTLQLKIQNESSFNKFYENLQERKKITQKLLQDFTKDFDIFIKMSRKISTELFALNSSPKYFKFEFADLKSEIDKFFDIKKINNNQFILNYINNFIKLENNNKKTRFLGRHNKIIKNILKIRYIFLIISIICMVFFCSTVFNFVVFYKIFYVLMCFIITMISFISLVMLFYGQILDKDCKYGKIDGCQFYLRQKSQSISKKFQVPEKGQNSIKGILVPEKAVNILAQEKGQNILVPEKSQNVLVPEKGAKYLTIEKGQNFTVPVQSAKNLTSKKGQNFTVPETRSKVLTNEKGQNFTLPETRPKFTQKSQNFIVPESRPKFPVQKGQNSIKGILVPVQSAKNLTIKKDQNSSNFSPVNEKAVNFLAQEKAHNIAKNENSKDLLEFQKIINNFLETTNQNIKSYQSYLHKLFNEQVSYRILIFKNLFDKLLFVRDDFPEIIKNKIDSSKYFDNIRNMYQILDTIPIKLNYKIKEDMLEIFKKEVEYGFYIKTDSDLLIEKMVNEIFIRKKEEEKTLSKKCGEILDRLCISKENVDEMINLMFIINIILFICIL
ncbi:uncharacterized protein VNE69_01395 [Vairimorpha necatrix]|uniref:Membrane protein n=1 Tax=Vairimorpha necatrix TaxID=6039 RepID=A0AAX4J901_9MICR